MSDFKKSLSVGALYLGALVGAGFATGRELISYFVMYGKTGLVMLGLSGLGFGYAGYRVLKFMVNNGLNTYSEFCSLILGKKLGYFWEIISFLFIIALYASMLSAFGTILNELLGLPVAVGSVAMGVLSLMINIWGVDGLNRASLVLSPILIIGSVLIGLWLTFSSVQVFGQKIALTLPQNPLLSTLIYISYNVLGSVSLLCANKYNIKDSKSALIAAFSGGIFLSLMALTLAIPLYLSYDAVATRALPMVTLLTPYSALKPVYMAVLFIAVLTTGAGCLCSGLEAFSPKDKRNRFVYGLILTVGAFLLSLIGFKSIVDRLYYIFGLLGLVELAVIVNLK